MFPATEHFFYMKFRYAAQCYSEYCVYRNFVVDEVSQLVAILNSSRVCEGTSEDYLTYVIVKYTKRKMLNQSSEQMHYIAYKNL